MARATDEIVLLLGELKGGMTAINARFDEFVEHRNNVDTHAANAREKMYRAQEDTRKDIIGMSHRLNSVEVEISSLKDMAGSVKTMTAQAAGAGVLGKLLLKFGGWLIAAAVTIHSFYTWLTK